jgi:hypothetical protein
MSEWKKQLLGLFARRAATSLAAFLVAHGAIGASDNAQFVEIAIGIIIWLSEALVEWWRTSGKVLVDSNLAKIKGVHPAQMQPPAPKQ